MEGVELWMLPLWYVVFLLAVTCHEAAHAWVARLGGDETAYLGGQVTLNPIPHIRRETFGTVVIPLLTFFMTGGGWMMGWASAPYDPRWERRYPVRAAAMAAAGPAANLVLAALAFAALKWGVWQGWWARAPVAALDRIVAPLAAEPAALEGTARFLSILFVLNFLLFLFNLLPFPPLDGASVVSGLVSPLRGWMDRLRHSPFGPMLGILAAWSLFPYVFRPVYGLVLEWL